MIKIWDSVYIYLLLLFVFQISIVTNIMTLLPNLNFLLALSTLIVTLASLCWQKPSLVPELGKISHQGFYHDQREKFKHLKYLSKAG